MKAKELMIGDWVTVVAGNRLFPEKYVGQTIPCKVMGFDENPIIPSYNEKAIGIDLRPQIGMMVKVANNFDFMYFVPERLSPIPLTHEFMAKNFGENKGRGYFYFDDFIELSIWEVNDGTFLVECDHVEFSSMPGEQVMVSAVHQLQHFLRHICYEKEIVL